MTSPSALPFAITPPDPPNPGILFVDHEAAVRSGHLGHALVEYAPGRILAFYPNCSLVNRGHSGDGWMEYKRSEDGGRTWGAPTVLPYSKATHRLGIGHSVMCEKAVRTDDGAILLFNLECRGIGWQPLDIPTCLRSEDQGRTWGPALPVSDQPGRIYDARLFDGAVFVLEFCNDSRISWHGARPDHHYALYVSTDNGRTFSKRATLPFNPMGRGYGTLSLLPDGRLIAYVYNLADERKLDYAISPDGGRTWGGVETAYFAKQIRNPQMAAFKGGYVLHGRSGSKGTPEERKHLVLYTSPDGIHWDEGLYLRLRDTGLGSYSNNLLVHDPEGGPERLLIQSSHAYRLDRTNILHWWLG